jgi:Transposase IS4
MVYQLAQRLPSGIAYIIYIDNYFTRVPFLLKLRAINISTCRTTRKYPEFPSFLIKLKDICSRYMEWNITTTIVVRKQREGVQLEPDPSDLGVICFAWQDNNTILICSTVYKASEEYTIVRSRRRPQLTSTNGPLVRKVFGNESCKSLPIPVFIDDYNHFIGSVNIADQFRIYYSTQRIAFRSWYPLFFWILNTAILNIYLIGKKLHNNYMLHKEF